MNNHELTVLLLGKLEKEWEIKIKGGGVSHSFKFDVELLARREGGLVVSGHLTTGPLDSSSRDNHRRGSAVVANRNVKPAKS